MDRVIKDILRNKMEEDQDDRPELPIKWNIFGDAHAKKYHATYSESFLFLNNFEEFDAILTRRHANGLTTHTLDLFGPGDFDFSDQCDSITAATLQASLWADQSKTDTIIGNLLKKRTWKQLEEKANQMQGFDLIFLRPVGGGELIADSLKLQNVSGTRMVEAALQIHHQMLKRAYKMLTNRDGMLYVEPSTIRIKTGKYGYETMDHIQNEYTVNYINVLRTYGIKIYTLGNHDAHMFKMVKSIDTPNTLPDILPK